MGELTWILERLNGMGIAAVPLVLFLWWMEYKKGKEQGERLAANTTAITVLATTVNTGFQMMLAMLPRGEAHK